METVEPARLGVDLLVDCVFKSMFGDAEDTTLVIHFLNAVLDLKGPKRIRSVEVLDPHNPKEEVADKGAVVDVKVTDEEKNVYQIEAQIRSHFGLPERIAYTLCQLVKKQLKSGETYQDLPGVVAIWILKEPKLHPNAIHLCIKLSDANHGYTLSERLAIHALQLKNVKKETMIKNDLDWWLGLFSESGRIDWHNPPQWVLTPTGRRVVAIALSFTDDDRKRDLYERQLEFEMIQNSERAALSRANAEKEHWRSRAKSASSKL